MERTRNKLVTTKEQGFSLIELVIAIALLAIVVVAFLGMFTFGFSTISTTGKKTVANYSAQSVIEQSISDSDSVNRTTGSITLIDASDVSITIIGKIVKKDIDGSIHVKLVTFVGN